MEVHWKVARFSALRAAFPDEFDAILCPGNSFPRVLSDADALDSFANMRDSLREGGVLVLRSLNCDKRWHAKPQRPYRKQGIESPLERTGFRRIEFYGSLQGEMFNAAWSEDLVTAAS